MSKATTKKSTNTRDAAAVTIGSVLAAALGAGIAAFATKGSSNKQAAGVSGPRFKRKGCGGCGR